MKHLTVLLALCPLLAFAEEPEELVGTLKFSNADKISGHPGGFDEEGNLIWDATALDQPILAKLKRVLEIRLQGGAPPEPVLGHQALLTLTNGDTIRGELTALDDEHVTLDTWYGKKLKIRRTMSKDLEIARTERPIYTGPEDLQTWTIDGEPNAWSLQGGVLASQKASGIARKIEMPDKCRIGFDLTWRNSLRFRVLLFSDDGGTSQPDNCYDLVCQRRFVYLRKRWMTPRSGGSRIVGQENVAELAAKEKVHMEFYVDRKAGVVALFVDGRQVEKWIDQDPAVGDFGNWLHFVAEDFYPVKVSRIEVSPWRGELPESTDTAEEDTPVTEEGQIIRLQNGDFVVGEVGNIVEGVLDITTKHCEMKIPVGRMRSINLSAGELEVPKRMNGDVKAWLREGGSLTFRLDSFTKDTLKGYSQTFGDAEFSLNAFSRIEFNIWEEELEDLRGGGSRW